MPRGRLIGSRLVFGILLAGGLFCGDGPALSPTVSAQTCSESQQRKISLTTLNHEGQLIENLRKEDLALTEDKVPIEILTVEPIALQPVSVAILIDISVSQERAISGTKLTAQKFLESVLSDQHDRATIVSFSSETKVEEELTNDLEKLRAAIAQVKVTLPAGYIGGGVVLGTFPPNKATKRVGATAIWDAIQASTEKLTKAAPNAHRVIVLLTDGEDTASKTKMRDAVRQAATSDVKIFSIGMGDDKFVPVNKDELRKVSEGTGGLAFFPKKVGDLKSIFNQIGKEIRSQYSITYCITGQKSDKSPRKVEIQFKDPVLRRSKARLSYQHYIE